MELDPDGSHPDAAKLRTARTPGKTPKAAACFARRVKFASQKYLPFRKTEIMI
jgi:hypothetical protein